MQGTRALTAFACGLLLAVAGLPARPLVAAPPESTSVPATPTTATAATTPTGATTSAGGATPGVTPTGAATPGASAAPGTAGTPAAGTPAAGAVSPTGTPAATAVPDASADPFRDREDQLALQLSRARVNAGLPPLARSAALDRAAVGHARDMALQGYMEHEAPDGSTPASRAANEGYETPAGSAWLVVEVISALGDAPETALGWWLSDGVHRRVVLGPRWREIGIGYASGGPYGRFWVADVGCRPDILPPVLLDGQLSIPDEHCGQGGSAFGAVQSVRVGETSAAAHAVDWGSYTDQQSWPPGHQAVVELRDAAGHELEMKAADPTGAPAESMPAAHADSP